MSLGKRLITTGGAGACTTETTDKFGDSSGVALYSLDYDASDASGSYDGTPANVDFGVGGQILYGARFNGSSSYIDTNLQMPSTTTFTFSAWVNTAGSVNQHIVGDFTSSATGATFRVQLASNNNISVGVGNGTNINYNSFGIISGLANTWKHIAVTVDGTTVKAYVDGVQHGTNFTSSYSLAAGSNDFVIGAYAAASSKQNFNGDIDQVRFFTSALDSTKVGKLYLETACVHTATTTDINYPVANTMYYKLDNSAVDETGNSTATEQEMQYRFGKYGQAGLFNGVSNGSEINTNYSTGDTALTHSIWMNQSGLGHDGFNVVLGAYWDGTTPYHLGYYMWTNATTITWVVFYGGDGGSASQKVEASGTITQNQWHHIVATWTDGTGAKLYIDGSLAQSVSSSQTRNKNGINVAIGGFGHNRSNVANFKGLLDTYRYFNSELSYPSQVTQLYNEKPEVDTSNFKAVLYEGNASTNYISNVGIDLETNGGFVWTKSRTDAYNHMLYDSVRGATNYLESNGASQNQTNANTLMSFEANGFFLGASDNSNYTNGGDGVSWVWKGGGTAATIAVNSITGSTPSVASDVSANTAAGFSIVKYTGNNTAGATVGHGLLSKPDMIIVKNLDDTPSWEVFHVDVSVTDTSILRLNKSEGLTSVSTAGFDFSAIDSSTFTLGTSGRTNSSHNFIAYCFHSVSGYSSIGTYTGNGNATGTIVSLDFAPSFVMIKGTDQTSDWIMIDNKRDTTNPNAARLDANSNGQEYTGENIMDLNSNGFQLKTSSSSKNGLNKVFIYMAFK